MLLFFYAFPIYTKYSIFFLIWLRQISCQISLRLNLCTENINILLKPSYKKKTENNNKENVNGAEVYRRYMKVQVAAA